MTQRADYQIASLNVSELHQVFFKQRTLVLYDLDKPECREWGQCPCCQKKVVPDHAERLSLCCSPEQLAFLGPGVPMHFNLIKSVLVFLCIPLAASLISGAMILSNYGFEGLFGIKSIYDSDEFIPFASTHFIAIVLTALYYPFSLYRFMNASSSLIYTKLTASAYTVQVSGINRLEYLEVLRLYIQDLSHQKYGVRPKIEAVLPVYQISNLLSIQKEKAYWEQTLARVQSERYQPNVIVTEEECLSQIQQFAQKERETLAAYREEDASIAFVAFKNAYHAQQFLASYEHSSAGCHRRRCLYGSRRPQVDEMPLKFGRPSSPEETYFENLTISHSKRVARAAFGWTIGILSLIGAGVIQGFFQGVFWYLQGNEIELSEDALFLSLAILVTNLVIEQQIADSAKSEGHSSQPSYEISMTRKIITLTFVNTAVTPIIFRIVFFFVAGFRLMFTYIVFVNAILPPIFSLFCFNPNWWLNRAKKAVLIAKLSKSRSNLLQFEANETCTPPRIDLARQSARMISSVYISLFFASLVETGIIWTMLGLGLNYWVTKYMLLHKHPKPTYQSEKLRLELKKWLRHSPSIYAFGVSLRYYFAVYLNDRYATYVLNFLSVFLAILGLVYCLIPINDLIARKKILNKRIAKAVHQDPKYQTRYRLKRLDLDTDFERTNPALQQQAEFILEQDRTAIGSSGQFGRRSEIIDQYHQRNTCRLDRDTGELTSSSQDLSKSVI